MRNKIIYSVLALVFSLGAVGFGYVLLGSSGLDFAKRFMYGFFFMMQFISTAWLVTELFRKTK